MPVHAVVHLPDGRQEMADEHVAQVADGDGT